MQLLGAPLRRRWARVAAVVLAAGSLGLSTVTATAAQAAAPPWTNKRLSPDQRANLLAAAMTFDEKLLLFAPNPAPGIPRLGIPGRREQDGSSGPHGISSVYSGGAGVPTTAFPAQIALTSTWNQALARAEGQNAGLETWNLGRGGWSAPNADLTRNPFHGRQWASSGEDPLLGGVIPQSVVQGVNENQGVYALAKHWLLNTQETQRSTLNNVLDERTLRELYVRQWEPLLAAGPGAVMCAFPKTNGQFACENPHLIRDILKGQLKFPGWVSSDFNACYTLAAFTAGTDVCGPNFPTTQQLREAVLNGTIPMARFNDMVHRVLRTYFARGLMDNPPPGSTQATTPDPQPLPASLLAKGRDLAYRIAVDGSVLLRNRAGALPLNTRDTRSIAVLGEGAGRLVEGFGADSTSTPSRITTVLGSVTARASRGVRVTHVAGMDAVRPGDNLPGNNAVPSGVLRPASGTGNGLSAQWFANPTFSGAPLVSRTEDQVNWGNALTALFETFGYETSPAPDVPTPFVAIPNPSIRWTGSLHPTATGRYSLGVTVLGHANLWIDGRQVLSVAANTLTTRSANLDLVAGRSYSVQIDYVADAPNQCCATSGGIGPAIRFSWVPPNAQASPQIQAAVRAARAADVAVVVANDEMGESLDRGSLRLQQNQDLLIQAVARANPNTIVVLMTGAPVVMPWLNQVAGVFESWYPGQEQGRAIAALLFGDEGFAGKLPVSWPRSEQQVTQGLGIQNPIYAVNKPGVNVPYNERIYVGYRGYDQKNLTPLFPFGYGLTYDRFRYRDIRLVDPVLPAAGRPGHAGLVRVRVQNRGDHRGTEIVQVYSGRLPTSAATPPRQLAGWARVTLAAGQTRWVDIPIPLNTPRHLLAYFNASTNRWVTPTGRVGIYVGSSERDIRLMGNFTVRTAR